MKTLIVMRHGKAEESAVGGDKKRALKGRGRREAEAMGGLIGELARPDLVVSSDAVRARQTAEIASEAFGFEGTLRLSPAIYSGDVDDVIGIVRRLPDRAKSVVLVGHNPVLEELSSELAVEGAPPVSLPTAGFAHLEFDVARWRDVTPGAGRLVGVHSPREET